MPSSPVAQTWKIDAPICSMALNRRGDTIALALGDGRIGFIEASDLAERVELIEAHNGVSLSLVADGDPQSFLSGGDDGQLLLVERDSPAPTPILSLPGKWIDQVAASCEGVRAYAIGKQVFLLNDDGTPRGEPLSFPSSIGGLAFSPNGKRLAVGHYNGISLIWVNAEKPEPELFPWKGSHLNLIWSPDSKIVLSSMQEGALHGWDLSNADKKEMQMQGYAAKIGSFAFTTQGRFLATSGADQIICWPFTGGGPWGKPPVTLGGSDGRLVTCVAPHPNDPIVAAGYEDGMAILAPLDGRMEIMLLPPDSSEGGKIVAALWGGDGQSLFVAKENGLVLLFTLASLHRYALGK